MDSILKLLLNNYYVKIILISIVIVILLAIVFSYSPVSKYLMPFVRDMVKSRLSATLNDVTTERDIYKSTAEQISVKYQELDAAYAKSEKEKQQMQNKLNDINSKLKTLNEAQPITVPKGREDLAKAFTNMGYSAHIVHCP